MSKNQNNQYDPDAPKSFWQAFNPGYLVAGLVTVWSAITSINKNFFENMWENGMFKAAREARSKTWQETFAKGGAESFVDLVQKIKKGQDTYHSALEAELKDAHIDVNSISQKWQLLKPHQQKNFLFTMLTVTAIGMGAVYAFSKDRKLAQRYHEQEQRDSQAQGAAR